MPQYTLDNGGFIRAPQVSHRIGGTLHGPHLVQDVNLLEVIQHVMHERIPERHVHAKGTGAFGEFQVTQDITDLTSAAFLSAVGKKTPLFARFSTSAPERGSADTVRDTRGFAFKLYTEEGNLDWTCLSTPTFSIRDGAKFPSLTHATKREPETGLRSATTFWDFMSHNPETFNTVMMLFSDEGTPKTYRDARIFGMNANKFIKGDSYSYCRITMIPDKQPLENLTQEAAERLAGKDPDALSRDLYNEITAGRPPSWTVYAQVVLPQDVQNFPVNPFDPTLRWPESRAPLREFGRITLNRNPDDNFAQTEQASFNPAAIVPGWGLSPDPILQTRLIAYNTAARYRLGSNFDQIPINVPPHTYNPTKRDGVGYRRTLPPGVPNYIVNDPGASPDPVHHEEWSGQVKEHLSGEDDLFNNYEQARELWAEFKAKEWDANFISNVAVNLCGATRDVREKTLKVFEWIHPEIMFRLRQEMEGLGYRGAEGQAPWNIGGIGG